MFERCIYLSTYRQDYIWHVKPHNFRLSQKPSCKRLSIPKFISQIKCKRYVVPWRL